MRINATYLKQIIESVKSYILLTNCVFIACAFALLPLNRGIISFKSITNILFVSLGIFLLCFWRDIKLKEFQSLRFVLGCLGVVIVMAYISVLWAVDSHKTLQAIRQFLLEPTLFMILYFLVVKRLSEKGLKWFYIMLFIAFCYHPFVVIYDFFHSQSFAQSGFAILSYYRAMLRVFHTPDATLYAFWLIVPFCLCVSIVFCFKKPLYRCIGIALCVIIFISAILNGSRFLILACGISALLPLVLLSYKHKAKILLIAFSAVFAMLFGAYIASDKLPLRYNLNNMINNFFIVWSYYPAEMGRFSPACYAGMDCSSYSKIQDSYSQTIRYEESSLSRIAAIKSGLLIASQNPFVPHGFGSLENLMQNLRTNYEEKFLPYRYTIENGERLPMLHIHHQWISFLCEVGIIGLLGISLFFLYIFIKANRILSRKINTIDSAVVLWFGCLVGALAFMFNFDIVLWREENFVTFVMCGIMLGICAKSAAKS